MFINGFRRLFNKTEETVTTPATSIKDAVNKAFEQVLPTDEKKEEEKVVEKELAKPDEKKDEKKEEVKDDEPSKEEIASALALSRALANPETQKEIVAALVQKVGLTTETTKKEQKEVEKTLSEKFKAALGTDLDFMSDGLFKAMDAVIHEAVESKVKDIREKVLNRETKEIETLVETGYAKVEAEFKNFKDVETAISKLQDDLPIKPGQDPYQYFRRLTLIAADEKQVTLVKNDGKQKQTEKTVDLEKAKRNSKDVSSRLTSERDEDVSKAATPQVKSIKDAVAQAVKLVEEQMATK